MPFLSVKAKRGRKELHIKLIIQLLDVCAVVGTLLQRWMKGPVCPDPHQTPTVCKDTCLHASCSLHPDAVCVMDVCDSCSPSFYKYGLNAQLFIISSQGDIILQATSV